MTYSINLFLSGSHDESGVFVPVDSRETCCFSLG